jgi:hypothetical protein
MKASRKRPRDAQDVRGTAPGVRLPMQTPGYDGSRDRLDEAMRRCKAQLEQTEATFARLGIGDAAGHLEEQVLDALEELWALDSDAPLDAYLDRRA